MLRKLSNVIMKGGPSKHMLIITSGMQIYNGFVWGLFISLFLIIFRPPFFFCRSLRSVVWLILTCKALYIPVCYSFILLSRLYKFFGFFLLYINTFSIFIVQVPIIRELSNFDVNHNVMIFLFCRVTLPLSNPVSISLHFSWDVLDWCKMLAFQYQRNSRRELKSGNLHRWPVLVESQFLVS